MIGMWTGIQVRGQLSSLNDAIKRAEKKYPRTEREEEDLAEMRECAEELAQHLADLHRIEG